MFLIIIYCFQVLGLLVQSRIRLCYWLHLLRLYCHLVDLGFLLIENNLVFLLLHCRTSPLLGWLFCWFVFLFRRLRHVFLLVWLYLFRSFLLCRYRLLRIFVSRRYSLRLLKFLLSTFECRYLFDLKKFVLCCLRLHCLWFRCLLGLRFVDKSCCCLWWWRRFQGIRLLGRLVPCIVCLLCRFVCRFLWFFLRSRLRLRHAKRKLQTLHSLCRLCLHHRLGIGRRSLLLLVLGLQRLSFLLFFHLCLQLGLLLVLLLLQIALLQFLLLVS